MSARRGGGSGRDRPAAPSAPRTRGSAVEARARRDNRTGLLFSAPFLVLFVAFSALPVVASLALSFTDFTSRDLRDVLGVDFVGLEQYAQLFGSTRYLRSLLNTLVFVVVGVPLTIGVGLILAVLLNNGIKRFRTVFRVGFYAPVVTSIVAVAVVWRLILQPDGLLNSVLGWVGISGPDWLQSTTWALPSLVAMAVWRNFGTLMVIFLAGLQDVPEDVIEAATMDGAGAWRRFHSIVLPLLRPAILFGAVVTGAGFLQFFEEPFVMTQGGPLDATYSAAYFAYDQFGFGNYGYASAASYVLFAAVVVITLIQFRLLGSKDRP
ncbi:sugar ABC transporter permease [Rathayibacter sp. Leaf299]|nr:sugar ABC transporter permease [Rathayibacter sp. Leaf299]